MITARGLTQTFTSRSGRVDAVRGIDIDVGEGEIVGLLGPNGAGKTTTLRMLTTLLRPTSGTATVAGADLLRDPVRARLSGSFLRMVRQIVEQFRIDLGVEAGALVGAGGAQSVREPAFEFVMRDEALGRTWILATPLDRGKVRLQLRQHARPIRGPCSCA